MKYNELQGKDQDELQEMLKELKVKLGKFRFESANNTLKDYSQLNKTKKDIARVATAINKPPAK